MPPYDPAFLATIPSQEPIRLVLVPLKCFYCDHAVEGDIYEWRIFHLFGIFHCSAHSSAARRDCETFMHREGIVRLCDARNHSVLGPFLTALGDTIPVLRSSGAVDTDWYIPPIDEIPVIRQSKNTGAWGFNLTNGAADKFIPLSQFRDSRVTPYIREEVRNLLDTVASTLIAGVYSE